MSKQLKREYLRFACRRGMLELDVLLKNFFDNYFDELTTAQVADFAALLTTQDQTLWTWLIGSERPEQQHLANLVDLIREHGRTTHHSS